MIGRLNILAWSLNGRDHQPSRALANIIARFAHGGVMIRDRPDQDRDNVLDIWTWMCSDVVEIERADRWASERLPTKFFSQWFDEDRHKGDPTIQRAFRAQLVFVLQAHGPRTGLQASKMTISRCRSGLGVVFGEGGGNPGLGIAE